MKCFNRFCVLVYVVIAMANSGNGGFQTGNDPAIAPSALAVGSVYNTLQILPVIFAPNGRKISYQPGTVFGRYQIAVNSTIVVNSQFSLHFSILTIYK